MNGVNEDMIMKFILGCEGVWDCGWYINADAFPPIYNFLATDEYLRKVDTNTGIANW